MSDELSAKRPPVISPRLVQAMDELLRGRKEITATATFSSMELASLQIPLHDFEAKIIAPQLASSMAHHLSGALVENALMSSVTDERRCHATEYRTRLAFLTQTEWTLLHRIKNTLAAEFGYPAGYYPHD